MSDGYSDQDLAFQLQQDLAEGESWHIEFKEYTYAQLAEKANDWKDALAEEFAALASIGGKIYIGISNDGKVTSLGGGTHHAWHEMLFERAVGKVQPKVNWKSYPFTDPATGFSLIRIDVIEGEPIYYVRGKPYIRDGTTSRPAEPEEVKARFKEYFTNREPILPSARERPQDDNDERSNVISWVTTELMSILGSINLYEQKHGDQLDRLKAELEYDGDSIESNLNNIKRTLGETSDYYQGLEAISSEILAATKVRFYVDGGKSMSEWLGHLKNVHDTASNLLSIIKSNVAIVAENLRNQEEDARDETLRWLNSIDDYSLNKFVYEANRYVGRLLRVYYLLWLSKDEDKASHYKELADKIETLSWAIGGYGYRQIQAAIPELQQKLREL